MSRRITAWACSNIALVKYWGKAGPGNAPATPSVSLALDALRTTVTISRSASSADLISLPDGIDSPAAHLRIADYLDYWRKHGLVEGYFRVKTSANFPAGAGLASSASSFAALAKALSGLAGTRLSASKLSRIARRGSGSAARSIAGGVAALPVGTDPASRQLAAPEDISWGVVVVIVAEQHKHTGSRAGMELSRKTSPYYEPWLRQAKTDYRRMLRAIAARNFDVIGEIAESNMLAMHGVMLSTRPALVYWQPATLAVISLAAKLRGEGIPVYATTDAGPNVVLLCSREHLESVVDRARVTGGVHNVIISLPGGPAGFGEN